MTNEAALRAKEQGNQHFKRRELDQALACYTEAIELDPNNAIFYGNRAQTHILLENYGSAIIDCDAAIAADPKWAKAYYRKGLAKMAILQYKEANACFKQALAMVPGDGAAREGATKSAAMVKRQAFERAIAGDSRSSVLASLNYDGIQIEKSWTGPQLDIEKTKSGVEIKGLDEAYLKNMVQVFKDGGQIPKKHAFAIVAKATEILKAEATMVEVHQQHPEVDASSADSIDLAGARLTVVGDTHGQFYDLLHLFELCGPVVPGKQAYLFNGDFVDRGSWSCEVAFYLYVLKILYPQSVFLNRGNHETNDMNINYGFADECEHKYSKKMFEAFSESFGALPLATLLNQSYLVMHGGLFSDDSITLADIKKHDRFRNGQTQPAKEGIAMELLWTDPQDQNGRAPSKRGIGMQFGPDITERFCLQNKLRKVLRSHEVRQAGVEVEHNGRLITVFSAPNYCDAGANKGGVVHFTPNSEYDASKDDGEGYRKAYDDNCPWHLDYERYDAVEHPDIRPMAYSKAMGF
ncbi:serine/threonine-protein phosphatase T [Diutina catenulata]